MLKIKHIFAGLLLILSVFALPAHAAINAEINYQGRLVGITNVAVPAGAYNMRFKLYTSATGGVPVWTETDVTTNRVQVTNGLFSLMLGSTTPFTGVDWNQTLYLGVEIGGTDSVTPVWDGEMTPRKIIGTVASAFTAAALNAVNATSTNATTTNFFTQNAVIANLSVTGQSITNLIFGLATGTAATTTNFFSSISSSTNLFSTNFNLGAGLIGLSTTSQATTTSFFASTASSTNLFSTNSNFALALLGNSTTTFATTTNFFATTASSTNLFATNSNFASTTVGKLLVANSTTTSATSTAAFNSTASSTNLFSTNANLGFATLGNATTSNATTSQLTISTLTSGSIPFVTTSGRIIDNNGQLFWDNNQTFLGIGITNPTQKLQVSGGVALFDAASVGVGASNSSGLRIVAPISSANFNWMIGAQQNVSGGFEITPSDSVNSTSFSTPALVVKSDGKVGVGMTNPGSKFSVTVGTNQKASIQTLPQASLLSDYSTGGAALSFSRPNDGADNLVGLYEYNTAANGVNLALGSRGDIVFASGGNSDYTQATEKVRILGSNGNVGIGTTTPSGPLTVQTNSSEVGINVIGRTLDNGGQLRFYSNSGATLQAQIYSESTAGMGIFTNTSLPLSLGTNGATNVTILSGGNVGIGTTTPQSPLSVFASGGVNLTLDKATGAYLGFSRGGAFTGSINGTSAGNGLQFNYGPSHTFAMAIDGSGSVGIGTTNPTSLMYLDSTSDIAPSLSVDTHAASARGGNIVFKQGGVFEGSVGVSGSIEGNTTTDLGLFSNQVAGGIRFYTGGSGVEKMRLTSGGSVGIGTTSPASQLNLYDSSNNSNPTITLSGGTGSGPNDGQISFYSNSGAAEIARLMVQRDGANNDGNMQFYTAPNPAGVVLERMRIDHTGSVGIGTTNPGSKLEVNGGIARVVSDGDVTTPAVGLQLQNLTGTAANAAAPSIFFDAGNGGAHSRIYSRKNSGNTSAGGNLVFGTETTVGTMTDRMTLDSAGDVGVSTLAAATGNTLCYNTTVISGYNSFATCSSLRALKTNIADLNVGLSTFMQLNSVSFTDKASGENRFGFIAEDVNAVNPVLSSYYQGKLNGVDYNGVVSLTVKSLQEVNNKVDGLTLDLASATSSIASLQNFASTTTSTLNMLTSVVLGLQNGTSSGLTISTSTPGFTTAVLEAIGATFDNAILYIKTLLVDRLVAKQGVVIYDRVTGQQVCTVMESGVPKYYPGDCTNLPALQGQTSGQSITNPYMGTSTPPTSGSDASSTPVTSSPGIDSSTTDATSTPSSGDTASSTPVTP